MRYRVAIAVPSDPSPGHGVSRWANTWAAAVLAALLAAAPVYASGLLRTDSRTPYVHRLTLYDKDGDAISPEDEPANPYAPARTCGRCHPYDDISHGWHFNAKLPQGRAGEPWIFVDERIGVQLPLSVRGWPGTFAPSELAVTPWKFVQLFGRHYPGGGMGEMFSEKPADPKARWSISGALQIDCMLCHSAGPWYDACERAHQIERQNFRWVPTAASGVGIVRGDARKVPDNYSPFMPTAAQSFPAVTYNAGRFDANERVLFPIDRAPSSKRCYFCHTVRQAGRDSKFPAERDVHLAAGLKCADCHWNRIDHRIVRGYEGEADERRDPDLASFTCRGCHLGTKTQGNLAGNHFGAPRPRHAGLPRLHLEKLACTTCHAGPRPAPRAGRVQTSMAHKLGLPEVNRTDRDPPRIIAPVFVKTDDGKIEPRRIVWPSFWGVLKHGKVVPIPLSRVREAAKKGASAQGSESRELHKEFVIRMFASLTNAADKGDEVVYVRGGRLYRRTNNGKLVSAKHVAAKPYTWPLAHEVRPARQALGAKSCMECHSFDSPFFFSFIAADSGAPDGAEAGEHMYRYERIDPSFIRAAAVGAMLHHLFLSVLVLSTVVVCTVLIRHGVGALAAVVRIGTIR